MPCDLSFFVLLFMLSSIILFYEIRMNRISLSNILSKENISFFIVKIICIIGILVPVFFSIVFQISDIGNRVIEYRYSREFIHFFVLPILIIYMLFQIFSFRISKFDNNIKGYIICILIILSSFLLRLLYIYLYDQELRSDFLEMWNYAKKTAESHAFMRPTSLQHERTWASLTPLVLIFGTSPWVYKIANIVMITITAIISSDLVRRWISMRAAILNFIIIMMTPETYFASIITTHDIPGSLYLLVCIWLLNMIIVHFHSDQIRKCLIYSFALGFFAVILEIQRNIFPIFFLSLLVFIFIYISSLPLKVDRLNSNRYLPKFMLFVIFVFIIPFSFEKATIRLIRSSDVDTKLSTSVLAISNSYNDGTYASVRDFKNIYLKGLSSEDTSEFLKSVFLSDVYYNIFDRVPNFLVKAKRLYRLGSQGGFYYGRLRDFSKDQVQNIINRNKIINEFFSLSFLIILFVAIYKNMLFLTIPPIGLFPIIFMSMMSLTLLFFGESQPRYLFMGWFLWPMIITMNIDNDFNENTKREHICRRLSCIHIAKIIFIFMFIFSFIYLLFILIFSGSKYRLIDMRKWAVYECGSHMKFSECSQAIRPVRQTLSDKPYSMLTLMFPRPPRREDFIKVRRIFYAKDRRPYTFSVYIHSPYINKKRPDSYFNIEVAVNDHQLATVSIGKSNKTHYIKISEIQAENDEIKIDFILRSNIDSTALSWQKASLVNFKFARLYPE